MKINFYLGERFKNNFLKVFLILILFYSSELAAQTPPGDCPCDPDDPGYDACAVLYPECDPVVNIPINSEIQWLFIGGIVLAFYSFHKGLKRTDKKFIAK